MSNEDWKDAVLAAMGAAPRESTLERYVAVRSNLSVGFLALNVAILLGVGLGVGVYFGLGALGVPNGAAAVVSWVVIVTAVVALIRWRRRRRSSPTVRQYVVMYWEKNERGEANSSDQKQYGLGEDALVHADRWVRSGIGRTATILDRLTGRIVGIDANGVRIMGKDESGGSKVLHEWKR